MEKFFIGDAPGGVRPVRQPQGEAIVYCMIVNLCVISNGHFCRFLLVLIVLTHGEP